MANSPKATAPKAAKVSKNSSTPKATKGKKKEKRVAVVYTVEEMLTIIAEGTTVSSTELKDLKASAASLEKSARITMYSYSIIKEYFITQMSYVRLSGSLKEYKDGARVRIFQDGKYKLVSKTQFMKNIKDELFQAKVFIAAHFQAWNKGAYDGEATIKTFRDLLTPTKKSSAALLWIGRYAAKAECSIHKAQQTFMSNVKLREEAKAQYATFSKASAATLAERITQMPKTEKKVKKVA